MHARRPVAVTSSVLRAAIALLLLGAPACSTSPASPTLPPGPSFAGTWVGSVTPAAVPGSLQLTLMAAVDTASVGQGQYSGKWTIAFPDSRDNTNGLASGRAIGTMVTLTLQPSTPGACTLGLSGTLDSGGARINGSMAPMSCGTGTVSPVTLWKQ